MRAILNSPRILRTGKPLALEAIRQVCPAVFATEAHSSRGPRYRYVPTITPLEKLLANGWHVYEAAQQRAHAKERDPYMKHMLRLRRTDVVGYTRNQDGVPEVVLINAHDGTAAYHLKGGFFRFICTNGLMVGTVVAGFIVRHTVGPQTAQEVLEAGERVVTDSFPAMLTQIDKWRGITLKSEHRFRLAERALGLRYGAMLPKFPAQDLLHPRRKEDEGHDLWTTLNVIQENVLNGGWEVRSMAYARRSAVRPIERVTSIAAINGGIWDEAHKIAEEVS